MRRMAAGLWGSLTFGFLSTACSSSDEDPVATAATAKTQHFVTQYGIAVGEVRCAGGWAKTGNSYTCNSWPPDSYPGFAQNNNALFTFMREHLPVSRARFFVPYDAVGSSEGGDCRPSDAFAKGGTTLSGEEKVPGQDWLTLVASLKAAYVSNQKALIVVSDGTGIGGTTGTPDPTTERQRNDYRCGVRALMHKLQSEAPGQWHVPVQYEAYNEPDLRKTYASREAKHGHTGTWKAGCLWYIMADEAEALEKGVKGFPDTSIAAYTASHPNNTAYLKSYWHELHDIVTKHGAGCFQGADEAREMPTLWAIHDYGDPTSIEGNKGGHKNLQQFEDELADLQSGRVHVIVTESGVQLDSRSKGDMNHPKPKCGNGTNTLGCLVDGNGPAQAEGGRVWKGLAGVSAGGGRVTTDAVYWYHFQLQNYQHAWDSALVDASGHPRPSFCAIVPDYPQAACTGVLTNYEDVPGKAVAPNAPDDGCYSEVLGKTVPLSACVQSKSDEMWYQCDAGKWVPRWQDTDACSETHALAP